MKIKTTLAVIALTLMPTLLAAQGCSYDRVTASACAEGQVFDPVLETCVTPATS